MADLFNATYEVMLQMLVRFFAHTEESEEELQTLSSTAVNAMSVLIKAFGTTSHYPAGGNGVSARVRGRVSSSTARATCCRTATPPGCLVHERLLELAVYCAAPGRPLHQS